MTHPEVGIDTKSQRNIDFTHVQYITPLSLFPPSQLKATFCLPLIGVKKNPQSPMYTQLGVITKGTVIEVRSANVLSGYCNKRVLESEVNSVSVDVVSCHVAYVVAR